MNCMDQSIYAAAQAIVEADTILITAGAGIGVDSGLPDFRGNQGFWNLYPTYARQRLTFSDLANPMWFHAEPHRAWGFYGYRYNLYKNTEPHDGFGLLRQWQDSKPNPGFVVTSNVDGQFQKSGFFPDRIYECHGSILYLQCLFNCHEQIWPTGNMKIKVDQEQFLAIGDLPSCPYCGELARPNILMFGDAGWLSTRSDLQRYAYQRWRENAVESKLAVIEIGAGFSLGTIRSLSQSLPAKLIRINPRDFTGPERVISIEMTALQAIYAIDQAMKM